MALVRLPGRFFRALPHGRRASTTTADNDEYTAVPQYPPILDLSYEKRQERKKQAVHDAIRDVRTVEEKQIKLNMPRYWGFKCYMLREDEVPYDSLRLVQHVTRTHLIETAGLPDYYKGIDVDRIVPKIKPQIEEALMMECEGYMRAHDIKKTELSKSELDGVISTSIIRQLNRTMVNGLSERCPHLVDTQTDYDPRIESFWFAGGMHPPEIVKKYRDGQEWCKHMVNDPTDRAMQYVGKPAVTLRNRQPLNPVVPYEEAENDEFSVPYFQYDPRVVYTKTQFQHGANVPGFWPGDVHQFAAMSYHKRSHLLATTFEDPDYPKEALHRQGITASFGWLNALSNFLGFTTYNDITYPLVTQTVITDGRLFSFYIYQLNTLAVYGKNTTENPKRNICWALPEAKLYDEVKDGKLIGLNDELIGTLLRIYANVPEERLGVNMTPYLSQEGKYSASYGDDDKRQWLEREYKHLVSNRPRHRLPYEIYHWEKIYKIDHKTRQMEARRRPFELNIKPFDRTLDDRQEAYIPRVLRPDLPRWKGRYRKSYFP